MPGSGMILVTGATGNVGGGVIASLTAMGANVRALVHDESKSNSRSALRGTDGTGPCTTGLSALGMSIGTSA